MKKSTAMEKAKNKKKPIVKLNDTNSLIEFALKSDAGLDKLDRILKMKHDEEARESEKLFHINFCEMQSEFPVIPKTKTVNTKAGVKMYSYAPLEKIIQGAGPVIAKHGFSYRWAEDFPKERIKKLTLYVTGYNHTETCSIEIPIMAANDYVNSIQQAGSSTTYGKRYTFLNMFGIIADEDDDGRGSSQPVQDKKKAEPQKQTDQKPSTPSVRDSMENSIKVSLKTLGCVTKEDCQKASGVHSLSYTSLEELKSIDDRLKESIKMKNDKKPEAK